MTMSKEAIKEIKEALLEAKKEEDIVKFSTILSLYLTARFPRWFCDAIVDWVAGKSIKEITSKYKKTKQNFYQLRKKMFEELGDTIIDVLKMIRKINQRYPPHKDPFELMEKEEKDKIKKKKK